MADKQTGTGGKSGKTKSRGDEQTKNPVSAKNNSKQKKDTNRSSQGNKTNSSPRSRS